MEIVVDADAAGRAAAHIATRARASLADRPRFALALSGGSTVPPMLAALAGHDLAWDRVDVFQVDERIAPEGHPDRNIEAIHRHLGAATVHPVPVHDHDPADAYARRLEALLGSPAVLDLVQLGLGADGHTASLLPGDPALDVTDRDVALTGSHQGRRRVTLTFPAVDRARERLWLVTGEAKRQALEALRRGDPGVPAGRVSRSSARVIADPAAAGAG